MNTTKYTNSLSVLQFNINNICKQKAKLENTLDQHKIDIATRQETHLEKAHKTPQFNNYTTLRQDRIHNAGGGFITLVKNNIRYTPEHISASINIQKIELQITKIHINKSKHIYITNINISPIDTTRQDRPAEEQNIANTFSQLTQLKDNW